MRDLPTPFGPVLIIGTGMIGASFGGLIRETFGAASVLGIDRELAVAEEAVERGHISAAYEMDRLDRLVPEVGLIVLATPIEQVLALLPKIEALSRPGTLVLDVGSAKSRICAAAEGLQRFATGEVGFIGGHPMAGARQSGVAAANPIILHGAPFVLCPLKGISEAQLIIAREFLEEMGFSLVQMQPADHDRVVAVTSHVPHLLAALLSNWVGEMDENRAASDPPYYEIAGGGLDRMTAKAAGLPEMWSEIIWANTEEVSENLRELSMALMALVDTIEGGKILEFLTAARDRRAIFEMTNYRHKRRPST